MRPHRRKLAGIMHLERDAHPPWYALPVASGHDPGVTTASRPQVRTSPSTWGQAGDGTGTSDPKGQLTLHPLCHLGSLRSPEVRHHVCSQEGKLKSNMCVTL